MNVSNKMTLYNVIKKDELNISRSDLVQVFVTLYI